MHPRPRFLLTGMLVGACLVGFVLRPSAQQQGLFRTHITLVPVNVRVLDKDGKPVTDLKQEDFVVLEDGRPQRIQHFSVQASTPQTDRPLLDERPKLRQVPKLDLVPQTGRVFLFVLGRGRLQVPSKGIDGALTFIRQQLLPQDYVAVLAYNRATDFTRDHEKVAQVLERFKRAHEAIEARLVNQLGGLAAVYGNKRIPDKLQGDIDAIFKAPGAVGTRDVPSGGAGQDPRLTQDQRRVTDALQRLEAMQGTEGRIQTLDELQANAYSDLGFDDYASRSAETFMDMGNIQAGIEYLRYVEGEKHIVFLTERGLFLPRTENDKDLASLAADARVVLDTIQTGGLPDAPVPSASSGGGLAIPGPGFTERFAISSLKNVSMLTGGQSSAYEYADKALTRINDATRAEYLIGYYPTNQTWDNRYRRIVLRVNRPGVTVLYRHGYFGSTVAVPIDHRTFLTYRRIAAAGTYDHEVKDIEITAKAAVTRDEAKVARRVTVDLVFDISKVVFKEIDDRHVAAVDLSFFCADEHERIIGELWQKMDLKLLNETYERLLKEGVPYKFEVNLRGGEPKYVKVIAYNYEADLVGSAIVKIK